MEVSFLRHSVFIIIYHTKLYFNISEVAHLNNGLIVKENQLMRFVINTTNPCRPNVFIAQLDAARHRREETVKHQRQQQDVKALKVEGYVTDPVM